MQSLKRQKKMSSNKGTGDKSLSSMDAFSKVDNLVSKPVLGSDGAASWQEFRKDHKRQYRPSVAPKAPLKKADKLGTGLKSWEDERKNEDQIRKVAGEAHTGAGYTQFKQKNNAEEAQERKRAKLIESRTRPDDQDYFIAGKTFNGWKFDYVFTTRPNYGTGYYWDGMDSIKKLRGEEVPHEEPPRLTSKKIRPKEKDDNNNDIEKPKKKKRKKLQGPVIVNDPTNPLEQVAAVIQKRQQLLSGQDPTLPQGWEVAKDPFTGKPYYFNRTTGEQCWEKPIASNNKDDNVPLPDGWETVTDKSTGKVYYCNRSTGERSWDRPTNKATEGSSDQQKRKPNDTDSNNINDDDKLPDGWQAVPDKQTGKTYFYHSNGRTQWDKPTA